MCPNVPQRAHWGAQNVRNGRNAEKPGRVYGTFYWRSGRGCDLEGVFVLRPCRVPQLPDLGQVQIGFKVSPQSTEPRIRFFQIGPKSRLCATRCAQQRLPRFRSFGHTSMVRAPLGLGALAGPKRPHDLGHARTRHNLAKSFRKGGLANFYVMGLLVGDVGPSPKGSSPVRKWF